MKWNLFPYLQLLRPANIVTAIADIMAGFALSGCVVYGPFFPIWNQIDQLSNLLLLILTTIGLYGGGVLFNDVFDAKLDAIERPERPIPSGRANLQKSITLGISLFVMSLIFAFIVSYQAGIIAFLIIGFALLYNKIGKYQSWGPINMGTCRGLNLLLGMACGLHYWYFFFVPLAYISAITIISRGEVHGGKKTNYFWAAGLYVFVLVAIFSTVIFLNGAWALTLVFLAILVFLIFPPLNKAYQTNEPIFIMKAVKAGVISLIIMDAAIAAGFGGLFWSLVIASLLPLSKFLAKRFAVT